tara:strand:+ start:1404 stop:1877 length:474 start_codon:yes stop_codon:yes gene_type:complete
MVTVPGWTYKGHIVNDISDMPENTYGFIYETKHIPSGKKYLGKKVLFFERNKRLGKRALQALKEERAKKGLKGRVPLKQKVITESDWKDYYGSHKDILKLVKEDTVLDFERKILCYVPNKKLLTYFECKYLFINEVLENSDTYINDNILGKFYRKDF